MKWEKEYRFRHPFSRLEPQCSYLLPLIFLSPPYLLLFASKSESPTPADRCRGLRLVDVGDIDFRGLSERCFPPPLYVHLISSLV